MALDLEEEASRVGLKTKAIKIKIRSLMDQSILCQLLCGLFHEMEGMEGNALCYGFMITISINRSIVEDNCSLYKRKLVFSNDRGKIEER